MKTPSRHGALTGAIRFRQTWRGKMIAQVEFHDSFWLGGVVRFKNWRDMKLSDLKTGSLYGHTGTTVFLRVDEEEPS
jgi:hypothetical protein